MPNYRLAFDHPYYLVLIGLVPLVWLIGRSSLAGLAAWRRWTAIALRSLLIVLVVLALAEVQIVRTSHRMAVIYVVDRSASVPAEKSAMLETRKFGVTIIATGEDDGGRGAVAGGRHERERRTDTAATIDFRRGQ